LFIADSHGKIHSRENMNGEKEGKSRRDIDDEEEEEGEDGQEEEEEEEEEEGSEEDAGSNAQASKSGDQVGTRKMETGFIDNSNRSQKGGKAVEVAL
jgi:hypothetical protein